MSHEVNDFKSGYIAIIGAPNVGKSTLLNRFLGQKTAIVSPRPQTTRNRILGILTRPEYQIIFLDTPGIHKAKNVLGEFMVKAATDTLREVDVVLLTVDAGLHPFGNDTALVIEKLHNIPTPVILAINKIDLIKKETLLPLIAQYKDIHDFKAIVPVSALTGEGVDLLLTNMLTLIPAGVPYYPADMITDQPERFIAAEIIREKIFLLTSQEIPYATAVIIDEFKENAEKQMISISATIYVEKDSQKGIVIGKGGSLLKKIGEAARKDIEVMVGAKVFLRLWVKIRKGWAKNPEIIKQLGY
ncbi:MAG: GTPase Era [Thermodesulfobacteriota bacterium]|nr:GTPase Era [Thermodesulfobacteriota bacterium]